MSRRSPHEINDWSIRTIPDKPNNEETEWWQVFLGLLYIISVIIATFIIIPEDGVVLGIIKSTYWPLIVMYNLIKHFL